MVKASLKKVFIKNFKSLHDCEIDIGKMNVVVGANASGKSNLIEAFRLLKKIYVEKDSFPFLEWWGYDNVVWQRKEELPIIIGLTFDIEGYEVYFETNLTGAGGKFQILREVLDLTDYGNKIDEQNETFATLSPAIQDGPSEIPLYNFAADLIKSIISRLSILYPLNIRLMKIPQQFKRDETLKEDGTNISSLYHTIYLKEGKIPEEIYNQISMIYPDIDARPLLTEDGRVMIKFYDDGAYFRYYQNRRYAGNNHHAFPCCS